jgi:hypothetical protein
MLFLTFEKLHQRYLSIHLDVYHFFDKVVVDQLQHLNVMGPLYYSYFVLRMDHNWDQKAFHLMFDLWIYHLDKQIKSIFRNSYKLLGNI